MKSKSFFFLILLISAGLYAQDMDKVKFDAQIRPRIEFNDADFNSGTGMYTYTYLRTRAGAKFTPVRNIMGYVQFQDSRIFGQEISTMSNEMNVDVHQAFFKVSDLFKLPVDIKVGRMEVAYSNQRLMGSVGWSNVGRSFDGGIASFKFEKVKFDLFALQEQERYLFGDSLDKSIYGLQFDIALAKNYKFQPIYVYQNTVLNDFGRHTVGFYEKGNAGSFWQQLEFAYQLGKLISGNVSYDISAFMFAVNLGYSFSGSSHPWVSVGVDYLSGDDDMTDTKTKVFNTLYATNHKFYGFMDYFTNIPNDTYGLGLMDMHAKVGAAFTKKFHAGFNFHLFNSNADYTMSTGGTASNFGLETDLTLKYLYNKYFNFVVGASYFSPGEIFKDQMRKDGAMSFYLMGNVSL